LGLFCVDAEEVDRVECEYRARDIERLTAQVESGNLLALKEKMFSSDNPLGERVLRALNQESRGD
jgi:hypothetical protein